MFDYTRYHLSKEKLEKDLDDILLEEIKEGNDILKEYNESIKKYDEDYNKFLNYLKELVKIYKDYKSFLKNNFTIWTKKNKKFFITKHYIELTTKNENDKETLHEKRKLYSDLLQKIFLNCENIIKTYTYSSELRFIEVFNKLEYEALTSHDCLIKSNNQKKQITFDTDIFDDIFPDIKMFLEYNVSENTLIFFEKLFQTAVYSYGYEIKTGFISKNEYLESYNKKINNLKKYIRKRELVIRGRKLREEKDKNIGYVYVLSNKAYPNIYKIGSTYNLPEERAEELTGTGHLTPFKVEYNIEIKSAEYFEKLTHEIFAINRVDKNREFFEVSLDVIKDKLNLIKKSSNNGKKKLNSEDLK